MRLLVLLAFLSGSARAQDFSVEKQSFELHEKILAGKLNYNANRPLDYYVSFFDEGFKKELLMLDARGRWLDVGAGAGQAAIDYLSIERSKGSVTAVSVEETGTEYAAGMRRKLSSRLSYRTGRFIESYSKEELGQFRIVTDVYGAVAYSPRIDLVFANFGELTEPGGLLFVMIPRQIHLHVTYDYSSDRIGELRKVLGRTPPALEISDYTRPRAA